MIKTTYQPIFDFEDALAEYTGAPCVVLTDCCTHAIELCMRYYNIKKCSSTAFTYISVIQCLKKLGIHLELTDEKWIGEYRFGNTNIWDSARRLEKNMYKSGQIQCLSFGINKPLSLGRMGAILLDDTPAYKELSKMRADGRDLRAYPYTGATEWAEQNSFGPAFHYCPTLEDCKKGLEQLPNTQGQCQTIEYPDCRKLEISILNYEQTANTTH